VLIDHFDHLRYLFTREKIAELNKIIFDYIMNRYYKIAKARISVIKIVLK